MIPDIAVKEELLIIKPRCTDSAKTARLDALLAGALCGRSYDLVEEVSDLPKGGVRGRRILFAVSLGVSGVNLEYYELLKHIRTHAELFADCLGALIVDGAGEYYTKSVARELVLAANMAGCAFLGRPLVEGTGTLDNMTVQAHNLGIARQQAYEESAAELIERLVHYPMATHRSENILALHAGNKETSNTLGLWGLVKAALAEQGTPKVRDISLRDGEVYDCRGCSYEMCRHMGETGTCFYGGVITQEVYPAILTCDALVMVCPNYNDAIGGNLTAFINRLSALYSTRRFYEKRLYAIIVSGYSGSDIVAAQLISGLCMNKSFFLPPRFALMETANDPGAVLDLPGIEARAEDFARRMLAV